MDPAVRRQLLVIAAALAVVGVVGFAVVLGAVVDAGGPTAVDVAMREWLMAGRSETWTPGMIVVSFVFGPIFFPFFALALTIAWVLVARHLWRPILLAAGTGSAVAGVRLIAIVVGRERPPAADMLTEVDTSESFPSGHVVGAATFILLIAYLVFSRRQSRRMATVSFVIAGLAVVVTSLSRMYLGYHWATDVLGSVFLGLVVLGAVIAIDTHRTTVSRGG
ncbi:MAG TPA: phosphatase PAP2 family protein [Pseudolysinimonas sp.]|nr:phosphatase PAP2 family protein [Pseudolysinimonas sp.]